MKLLITGAAGFVGAAVARAAVANGHEVIASVRQAGIPGRIADLADSMAIIPLDLRNLSLVKEALLQHRPDVVVHVAWAGVGNKSRFERLQISDNIEAACGLVEAAVESGVRKFIGIGSQGEYGPLDRTIDETQLPQPTTLYGAAKLSTHHLTQQFALQGEISRSC